MRGGGGGGGGGDNHAYDTGSKVGVAYAIPLAQMCHVGLA